MWDGKLGDEELKNAVVTVWAPVSPAYTMLGNVQFLKMDECFFCTKRDFLKLACH